MKTRSIFLILFLIANTVFAQTTTGISVQGIARDANRAAVAAQDIPFTFTVTGTPDGGSLTEYYQESKILTTDAFGVFSHILGSVDPSTFANVDFGVAHMQLKVEAEGVTLLDGPLQYSPYAKYADKANNGVPVGGVIMWSGNPGAVPAGWELCDGNNGTPNLSGRFIVGYGSNFDYTPNNSADYDAIGDKGGEEKHTLTVSEMPGHSHTGTTSWTGAHSHRSKVREANGLNGYWGNDKSSNAGSWDDNNNITSTDGDHNHTFTSDNTGGGQSHENRPPYYVLAYIMRVQ